MVPIADHGYRGRGRELERCLLLSLVPGKEAHNRLGILFDCGRRTIVLVQVVPLPVQQLLWGPFLPLGVQRGNSLLHQPLPLSKNIFPLFFLAITSGHLDIV